MKISTQNIRLIFGLKVKQLRQQKSLSFSELSTQTGISVSYLNEIEKGKKYPKEAKIQALAKALEVEAEELKSTRLSARLQPISELLHSNFLNELPLDIFGIEPGKIVELVANAPSRVGAFISAILEISRNFQLQQEHFFFAALRSYQELHNNYFEDLEEKAEEFANKYHLPRGGHLLPDRLFRILESKFGYTINRHSLAGYPELNQFRSVFIPKKKKLMVNEGLTEMQQAFLVGKEIGYNYLGLQERVNTSTFVKVTSFEKVLNNFKAGYFAGAIVMDRESLIKDVKSFFRQPKWDAHGFLKIMNKYHASPEMFLHRLTNLIPKFFGIEQLFFLRFNNQPGEDFFRLTKELHLSRQHQPHGNGLREHYCRRWITLWLLNDLHRIQLNDSYSGPIAGIQRSKFLGTDDEYLCITLARPNSPTPNTNVSVSIGLLINDNLREQIAFVDDLAIPRRVVNQTCERCSIMDCKERVAPPTIIDKKRKTRQMLAALNNLSER